MNHRLKALGWTNQEAIGKEFKYGNQKGHIIGVINDFHFESMHQAIVPMILCYFPPSRYYFNNLSIKIGGNNISAALAYFERTWKKYLPETPADYTFLDETFASCTNQNKNRLSYLPCLPVSLFLLHVLAYSVCQRLPFHNG